MSFTIARNSSKLSIGTAQFGLNYGITNNAGKVASEEVESILNTAIRSGIDTIDTAYAYDDSEEVLGSHAESRAFQVITKVPNMDVDRCDVLFYLRTSLWRLRRQTIYGLLLHNVGNIHINSVYNSLLQVKNEGLVTKIGVSVYSPDELLHVIQNYDIDIVQFPMNIFDQRFIPLLDVLKKKDIIVCIRSLFLQGVLLEPQKFVDHLIFNTQIARYMQFLREYDITPINACYDFITQIDKIDKIVIGLTSAAQCLENITQYQSSLLRAQVLHDAMIHLATDNQLIINPSLW